MALDLTVPSVGESITEAIINAWLKDEGDYVAKDELIAELETEKVTVEFRAPSAGTLTQIIKKQGDTVNVGDVIATMEEGAAPPDSKKQAKSAGGSDARDSDVVSSAQPLQQTGADAPPRIMPAAQAALAQKNVPADRVTPTGPGGRMLKEDVLKSAAQGNAGSKSSAAAAAPLPAQPVGPRHEEAVPLSPMRKTIARRLVEAQQSTALLTTFNETDMTAVMSMRKSHGEAFEKKYGVKLGFMSFFVKAVIDALRQSPAINAEIREDKIIYKNYYDIGIAVSTEKGLVVPVLRNAEQLSFADTEKAINDFAARARGNQLQLSDLEGGTFTITNGGIFGSLLSTPIINPPQSGVLGMHTIQKRPVAVDDQVVIRPMMYLALTYDHRIVDGKEAVTFLKRIKQALEEPARMLIEV